MAKDQSVVPIERIVSRVYLVRGEKVMLDTDLAQLYGVSTGRLNEQVKRNKKRFPEDFAFRLTRNEFDGGRGQHRKYLPYVFTEHGVAMLSSVQHSSKAVQVNIGIVRALVKLSDMIATDRELARKVDQHDRQIAVLFDSLRKLLAPPDVPKKYPIGYIHPKD